MSGCYVAFWVGHLCGEVKGYVSRAIFSVTVVLRAGCVLSPVFYAAQPPSLSDLHHKFPCLLLTGWFLFRAGFSESYCMRVSVVTVLQKEGGKWQTKRGEKES